MIVSNLLSIHCKCKFITNNIMSQVFRASTVLFNFVFHDSFVHGFTPCFLLWLKIARIGCLCYMVQNIANLQLCKLGNEYNTKCTC